MATVPVYNQEGKESGTVELSDAIFGVQSKGALIYQVYEALRANAREPWADTKNRGEVSGGGKKPWAQKGTGRARHGSIRSPIWKGGGVAFGPLSTRNYKQKINQKMKQQAVRMCLSDKVAEKKFLVVESFDASGKTKAVVKFRTSLPCAKKTTLMVAEGNNETLRRATRNIPHVSTVRASDVNVVDLLNHQFILVNKAALEVLQNRLAKSKSK